MTSQGSHFTKLHEWNHTLNSHNNLTFAGKHICLRDFKPYIQHNVTVVRRKFAQIMHRRVHIQVL